jgi:hypothetical protein
MFKFLCLWLFFITPQTTNLLIGDSQTPSIAKNSKLAVFEPSLQHSGWRVSHLIKALETYKVNTSIKRVFICIGTNGVFSPADDIVGLNKLLINRFPNAKLYVIYGSFGWYNSKYATEKRIETYYKRFAALNIQPIKTGIGYAKQHPDLRTKSIIQIAKEIDSIIHE